MTSLEKKCSKRVEKNLEKEIEKVEKQLKLSNKPESQKSKRGRKPVEKDKYFKETQEKMAVW